uniref:Vacuolar protein sorting-associated protein 8 homolog n=3 Tax=Cacopsylla melanoneura TaxID=428564 RepID=A0A8D8PJZ2_9HEMI
MEGACEEKLDINSLHLDFTELDEQEFNIPNNGITPTLESILNEQDEVTSPTMDYHEVLESAPSNGGEILRHIVLRSVSTQLCSACDRVNAGRPTVMCVSSLICVGTSHGLVLGFDASQQLKWCHEEDSEQGAVTALGLSVDCTRLLAGYARGVILMFNVTEAGKVLRRMTDVHSPASGVLHVKFTDSTQIAVCSDTGGSVFQLNFKRTLGVRSVESKCLFSGSRGEVCAIEPLLLSHLPTHPLQGSVILAMATLSKVIIVSIKPTMRVLLTRSVQVSPVSLPLLSWQFVIIQVSESSRIMDPVLAFARDNTIYFFQVCVFETGKTQVSMLQQVRVDYSIMSCHWMNPRLLVTMDTNEVLHLLEVRSKAELESVDLSAVRLVYNSSHFKGLSTGGNVSQAMALAGERACYNTVQSFGNQLLLLGIRSLHVLTIRSWDNRLDVLVEQDKHIEAIRLGMEFMDEKNKIAFGLIGSHADRQAQVRTKVLGILDAYIAQLRNWRDIDIDVICELCVEFGLPEKMWNDVWRSVEHITSSRNIFLRSVERLLIKEKITQIPADVMQALLLHQQATGRYEVLEQSVLCADIDCLDIELVLSVSRERQLYDAFISVWNRGMQDYVTPLQALLTQLALGDTAEKSSLGNKLLVYISCCLSGRSYPRGEIEEGRRVTVRQQVCQCLCMQHTPNAPDDEPSYPYLRTLLKFNTREFLNALAIAQLPSSFQQRLFDVLISITLNSDKQYLFKPSEVGYVFAFIARNLTRGITVEDKHLHSVLRLLTTSTVEDLEARQNAFLEVITAKDILHEDSTLEMARAAEFYKVCSVLHEERGEHSLLLKCLLLDNTRKARVFDFIAESSHKASLEHFIVQNVQHFVEVDGFKTGSTVQRYFPAVFGEALSSLPEPSKLSFLQGGMEVGGLSTDSVTKYIQLCCQYDPDKVYALVRFRNDFKISPVLESVRQFKLEEPEAVLLENLGDFQAAFDILFRRLQSAIQCCGNIEAATESVVALGQVAGDRLNAQTTWLPLLQCLHRLESHETLKRILSCPNLNLASEFHLLLQHTNGRLGEYRTLIKGLFEKCKHEHVMLQSSLKTLRSDQHDQLASTMENARHGFFVNIECAKCNQEYAYTSQLVAFRCGHSFHHECTSSPPLSCNLCTT